MSEMLHCETPLVESPAIGEALGARVWLKLEALQPSGSFKVRGLGYACAKAVERGARALVTSSGGNAGVAVAYAGRALGVRVTVVVPTRTTPEARAKIAGFGAEVRVHGEVWDDAHEEAVEVAAREGGAYVHPFDDPEVWAGHASLVREVAQRMPQPDAVVLSVGGAGLLCGALEGMHAVGWTKVPVVAVETEGAASYAAALREGRAVDIGRIDSIATTLGARRVAEEAVSWSRRHEIVSHLVSDAAAVRACLRFLDDHRLMVEPSCGAALAAMYEAAPVLRAKRAVLGIVCGGSGVTIAQLLTWSKALEASPRSR
jgi:L-serine/L-threonine ammonia-lyase